MGGKIEPADGSGGVGQPGGPGDQASSQQQQHQQFLGDATQALPAFDEIKIGDDPLPDGLTQDDVIEFESMYREHCEVSSCLQALCMPMTYLQDAASIWFDFRRYKVS